MAYGESSPVQRRDVARRQTPTFLLGGDEEDDITSGYSPKSPSNTVRRRPSIVLTIDGNRHFYIDPSTDSLSICGELPGNRQEVAIVRETILSCIEQRFGLDREVVEKAVNDVLRIV